MLNIDLEALTTMNRSGLSDAEIGRQFSIRRSTIRLRRKKLGLPSNRGNDFHRQMLSMGLKEAYRRLGVRNSSDFRLAQMRRAAAAEGWPECINGRPLGFIERKILDALWKYGPQTIRQLCERLDRKPPGRRGKAFSSANRNCLPELERAGLVVNFGRVGRDGKRSYATHVYAIAINVERNQKIV